MLQSFHRRKKSKSYPVLSLCRRRLKKDRQYGRKCNAKRIELAIKKVIRCVKKEGGGKKQKSEIKTSASRTFIAIVFNDSLNGSLNGEITRDFERN